MGDGLSPGWGAFARIWAADVEMILGDLEAGAGWAEAAEGSVADDDRRLWVVGSAQTKLAVALHVLGRPEPSLGAALRALAQFRGYGVRQAMTDGWTVELAPALYVGGRLEVAFDLLRQGASAMRRNGVDQAPNQFLHVAASVEYLRGQPARAARLLGAARSAGGADKVVMAFRTPSSMSLYRRYLPLVREALGPDEARRLRDEGRSMTLDEAFAHALEGIDSAPGG